MNSRKLNSLKYRNFVREYKGFTVFAPLGSKSSYLVDMKGRVVHKWELPLKGAHSMKILRNGNFLYMTKIKDCSLKKTENSRWKLIELDWNSKIIWEHEDKYMHHSFCRLKNGNTLFLKRIKLPYNLISKVKGGIVSDKENDEMWTDAICEVNKSGKVVYEWKAYEHLDMEKSIICPIDFRNEWTRATSINIMNNNNILINFMLINTIAIINKKTGNIDWSWGPGEVAHPNYATELKNGNILIFDNGLHSAGGDFQFSKPLKSIGCLYAL